jgi:alpha-methylacyl-CoA racemase
MAVGCIEPHFYAQLVRGLELDPAQLPDQNDQNQWPKLKAIIAARFAERPRAEWAKTFDGTDACVTAVVTLSEAHEHPQMQARATLRRRNSQTGHYIEPAPAPRLHKAVEMGESRGDNS